MSALRELLVSFGISVDDRELKKGHEEVNSFKETLLKLGEALGVAFGLREIKEFIGGTIEAGARTKDLSDRLDVATSDLQAFQYAASLVGVDADSAAMSIGFLNRSIGQAVTGIGGTEAAQIFQRLGVSLKDASGHARGVYPVMSELADAFAKLPDQQTRATYAMQLFGRQGQQLLPILDGGSEKIAALRAEFQELGGGMSDEFIKQAKEIEDEEKKLSLTWVGLKATIVGTLLPVLQPVVEWFKKIALGANEVLKHTQVLQTAFRFATGLAVVVGLTKIAMGMRAIAVNGLLAEAPILVMAAAMLALYLAYDELDTLLKGGDTLIGRALGPDKEKFVADLRASIDELTGSFKELLGDINDDGDAMGGFTTIVVNLSKALAWLVDLMDAVVEGGKKIGGAIGGLLFHEAKKDEFGGLAENGLTPEARAKLREIQGSGQSPYQANGEDPHLKRMAEIAAQMRAAHDARASLLPPSGASASTIPAYQPGGQFFQGPVYIPAPAGAAGGGAGASHTDVHNEFKTQIDVHTNSDQPRKVGQAVGSAVATEQQRSHEKAYRAVRKP